MGAILPARLLIALLSDRPAGAWLSVCLVIGQCLLSDRGRRDRDDRGR